jgi:hypothetical protein
MTELPRRQGQAYGIAPIGASLYRVTFALCDHAVEHAERDEALSRAAAHMFTCPPDRPLESDVERAARLAVHDGSEFP